MTESVTQIKVAGHNTETQSGRWQPRSKERNPNEDSGDPELENESNHRIAAIAGAPNPAEKQPCGLAISASRTNLIREYKGGRHERE